MDVLSLLALLAGAVAATPHPEQAGGRPAQDVIVVGPQDSKARDKVVHDYVDRLWVQATAVDPVARYAERDPACPGVAGLDPARAAAVAARMRQVARVAGVPLAPVGCRPTALVVITRDKKEMIEALGHKDPALFGDELGLQSDAEREAGPAAAWHLIGLLDRDARPVGVDTARRTRFVESFLTPSMLNSIVRPVIVGAVVVIEARALHGLTVDQVADYAAMRAFVYSKAPHMPRTADTILNILGRTPGEAVPATLTEWDMNYLRALYAVQPYRYGPSQRSDVLVRMIHGLNAAPSPGADPAAEPPR